MIITKYFEFESAHHLPNYEGKCHNLHGHSYKLEVSVEGPVDEQTGMVLDFGILSDVVKIKIIDRLDHNLLNSVLEVPTAENLIKWMHDELVDSLPQGITIKKIKLYETSKSSAEENY